MSSAPEDLTQHLTTFSRSTLTHLKPADISRTTTHLIIATAYFTGALLCLARQQQTAKPVYLMALRDFLMQTFRLAAPNAQGLIESNARLCRRYVLLENTYNAGWQSASAWLQQPGRDDPTLKALLDRYQNLGMSELGREGIKPEPVKAPEPATVTPPPRIDPAPVQRKFPLGRYVAIGIALLLIILTTACIYLLLNPYLLPETLPPPLQEFSDWLQRQATE